MRKLWIPLLAALVGLSLAGTVQAANLPYSGTVTLELGTLDPIPVIGSGVATINGSGGGSHLTNLHLDTAIQTTNTVFVPITDPAVVMQGIASLRATRITVKGSFPLTFQHLVGSTDVVTDPGGTGGVLPVSGRVLVCLTLLANCNANIAVPLTLNTTRGVGIGGGQLTINGFGPDSLLKLSVQGNPWTVNTAVVTGIPADNGGPNITSSRQGFVHGPASGTSSTAEFGGVVQLVTPVIVNTNLGGNEVLALFGTLRIQFIPEPGTLLLLGSGVAGLALLGRRRM